MTDEIVWATPSEDAHYVGRGTKPGRYKHIASACKKNPGQWAKVPGTWKTMDSAKGFATNVRTGKVQGFTKDDYEVAIESAPLTVFVRFIGKTREAAPDSQEGDPAPASVTEIRPAPGPRRTSVAEVEASKIRSWGLSRGYDLPERGRLPRAVIDAYHQAHGSAPSPATGTLSS